MGLVSGAPDSGRLQRLNGQNESCFVMAIRSIKQNQMTSNSSRGRLRFAQVDWWHREHQADLIGIQAISRVEAGTQSPMDQRLSRQTMPIFWHSLAIGYTENPSL